MLSKHHGTTDFLCAPTASTLLPSLETDDCPTGSGGSGHATEDIFDDMIKPLADEDNDEVERGIDLDLGQPTLAETTAVAGNQDESYQNYAHYEQYQQYQEYQQYEQYHHSPLASSAASGGSSPADASPAVPLPSTTTTAAAAGATMQQRKPRVPVHRRHAAGSPYKPSRHQLSVRHKSFKGRKTSSTRDDSSEDDADFKFSSSMRKLQHSADGPARASQRLRNRGSQQNMARFLRDDDYVVEFDEEMEDATGVVVVVGSGSQQGNALGSTMGARRGRRAGTVPVSSVQVASRSGRKSASQSNNTTVSSGNGGGSGRASPGHASTAATHLSTGTRSETSKPFPTQGRAPRRAPQAAAQRIRATSARHELKGRPSFSEIVQAGFMKPGEHKFAVGHVEVAAEVGDDGAITYDGERYRAISKFALVVLRDRNPSRQSCDGWKEVAWNGEKLDVLRSKVQQHARHQARQKA